MKKQRLLYQKSRTGRHKPDYNSQVAAPYLGTIEREARFLKLHRHLSADDVTTLQRVARLLTAIRS